MSLSDLGKRPLVMGILNITPDSFSGDGILTGADYIAAAMARAAQMLEDGADILDIGGESTRPGALAVSAEEEIRRTIPVIAAIKKEFADAFISIDTMKAEVAKVALDAGATMINDISALHYDAAMAGVAAQSQAHIILMHNRSERQAVMINQTIGGEYQAPPYGNVVTDVMHDLKKTADNAEAHGIAADKIILDPGIGFGKTVEQNLALINHLDQLKTLGYPVMIGPSRKSFIGRVLDTAPDERLEGTAAAIVASVLRGADIVRVHDVKFMALTVKMAAAIKGS